MALEAVEYGEEEAGALRLCAGRFDCSLGLLHSRVEAKGAVNHLEGVSGLHEEIFRWR